MGNLKGIFAMALCGLCSYCFGQYTVSYADGETVDPGGNHHDYTPTTGGYGGNSGGGGYCQGEVTVTFTYPNPETLPRPPKVILKKTSVATSFAGGLPFWVEPPTPANGLQDPSRDTKVAVPAYMITFYYWTKQSGTDANGAIIPHYEVVSDPPASFDRTCTPSAASVSNAGSSCSVVVNYSIHSVRIDLQGVIDQYTDRSLLIGSKLVATLTISGISINDMTDTFVWTISGGKKFANYNTAAASNQYTAWASPTTKSTTVYFAKPEAITITCAATLNSLPLAEFSVSTDLTSAEPDWEAQSVQFSSWHLFDMPAGTYDVNDAADPNMFRFLTIGNAAGCVLEGNALTASKYRVGGLYGEVCWAQKLIAPDWKVTANPPLVVNGDGITALDKAFPYPLTPNTVEPANGTILQFRDTPGVPGISSTWQKIKYVTEFDTYFFFKPPTTDAMHVPFCKFNWKVNGVADRTGPTTWSVTTNTNTSPSNSDYPDHLQWSAVKT